MKKRTKLFISVGAVATIGVGATVPLVLLGKKRSIFDKDLADFTSVVNSIKEEYTTSKKELFIGETDWKKGNGITELELGIDVIDKKSGTLSLSVEEINLYDGKIKIKSIIRLGAYSKNISFYVMGFKTELSHYENLRDLSFGSLQKDLWTTQDKNVNQISGTLNWEVIGITKPKEFSSEFNLNFSILSRDSLYGKIDFQLKISKPLSKQDAQPFESTLNIRVNGYKSTDDDINTINAGLKTIPYELQTTFHTVSASTKAAIGQVYSFENLGLSIDDEANRKFSPQLEIVDINDNEGEINAKLFFTYNGKSSYKDVVIVGFNSNNMRDVLDLLSFYTTSETTNRILPSNLGAIGSLTTLDKIGIQQPTDLNGISIVYRIDSVNDESGWAIISVEAKKGSAFKTKEIQINNFLTSDEYELQEVSANIIDRNTSKIDVYPRQLGTVGDIVTANQLGIVESAVSPGISVNYKIKSINDDLGKIELTVTISKPSNPTIDSIVKYITVSKFRSNQQDRADIQTFLDAFSNQQTSKSDQTASSIPVLDNIVNISDLGIQVTPPQNGVTFVMEMINVSDLNGTMTISVKASKGNSTNSKTIVISNFKSLSGSLTFANESITEANANLDIQKSYFGNVKNTLSISGVLTIGDTLSSYVVELTNGVKFVFPLEGARNFFSGYNFSASNENPQIKAKLYEFVRDCIQYLNFGIAQSIGYNITFAGPGDGGTLGATNTANKNVDQIYINYTYKNLQSYFDRSQNTGWGPNAREYHNAISTIVHETGHMEAEFALGLFHEDTMGKYDYALSNGKTYTENWREYDGTEVGNKITTAFSEVGIDIGNLLLNLNGSKANGWLYENTYNAGLSFVLPTATQYDTLLKAIYGTNMKDTMASIFEDAKYSPVLNYYDFTNKEVYFEKWDDDGDGAADSTKLYSDPRDWFINFGHNQFIQAYLKYEITNTTYIFNLHEFLTRIFMLLSQSGINNGLTVFAESIYGMMGNMLYSNPTANLPIGKDKRASDNGESFASYHNYGANSISSFKPTQYYFYDSIAKEYFNLGSRLGYNVVEKIIENREQLLEKLLGLFYGGFNKTAFNGYQYIKEFDTDQRLYDALWDNLKLLGTTTTQAVEVEWKRRGETTWNSYKIPASEYKRVVYKVGNENRVTSDLYYYNVNIPVNIKLGNVFEDEKFAHYLSNPSLINNEDIIIRIKHSNFVSNIGMWGTTDAYFSSVYYDDFQLKNASGRGLEFSPLQNSGTNFTELVIKYKYVNS